VYFRITEDAIELVEPANVRAFHVVSGVSPGALAARIADVGELLPDGEHVMVSVDAVRRYADGQVGPGWEDDLAGMVAYAVTKGWADEAGTRIRAHVEPAAH
jgi:hypothetical protein